MSSVAVPVRARTIERTAVEILEAVRAKGSLARREVYDLFGRNVRLPMISAAIAYLVADKSITCEIRRTGERGRPRETYYPRGDGDSSVRLLAPDPERVPEPLTEDELRLHAERRAMRLQMQIERRAQRIASTLKVTGPIGRNRLFRLSSCTSAGELDASLELLLERGLVRCESGVQSGPFGGRPRQVWSLVDREEREE